MNDLGKQLVVGFFISIALHGAFIFFAGMQYREQVKNIFWIDALVTQEEKKVYFASVVKPSIQEPTQKIKAADQKISVKTKDVEALPKESKIVEQKKKLVSANSGKKVLQEPKKIVEKKVVAEKIVSEKALMQKESVVQEPEKKKTYQHYSKEMIQKQQAERKARERFFVIAQSIKQEIATHWHPPVSEDDVIQAKVCCTLSPRGKIEQVDIVESSMIMAYDASILRALWKCKFIQDLWGKRFLLVLKK